MFYLFAQRADEQNKQNHDIGKLLTGLVVTARSNNSNQHRDIRDARHSNLTNSKYEVITLKPA